MSEPSPAVDSTLDREQAFSLSAPPEWWRWTEVRAIAEAASLVPTAPWLWAQPKGRGEDVVVIPGFATGDAVTAPLRWYLEKLGYRSHPWGLGVNRGNPEADAERLTARLDEIGEQPISLVGWSLGGVVARLVARQRPDRIRQVITLGSPVEGGPKYTAAGPLFAAKRRYNLDEFEAHVHQINKEGLSVPLTVIYSKADGIVGWRAAVDRYNAHARHTVLKRASHTGLIVNPIVWSTVAQALAHPS